MSAPMEVTRPYGPGAFNSATLPDLPVPAKKTGRGVEGWMKEPLSWGSYAGLEPAIEVSLQLQRAEMYAERGNMKFAENIDTPKNSMNWRFERNGRFPHILMVLKWQLFAWPWICWMISLGSLIYPRTLLYANSLVLVMFSLGATTFGLFGTKRQHLAHWMLLAGGTSTSFFMIWFKGTLWEGLKYPPILASFSFTK